MATLLRPHIVLILLSILFSGPVVYGQDEDNPIGLFMGFGQQRQAKQEAKTLARAIETNAEGVSAEDMIALGRTYVFAYFGDRGMPDPPCDMLLKSDTNPQAALKSVLIADELMKAINEYKPPAGVPDAVQKKEQARERASLFYRKALQSEHAAVVYRALQSIARHNVELEEPDFASLFAPLFDRDSGLVRYQLAQTAVALRSRYAGNADLAKALEEALLPAMIKALAREKLRYVQLKLIEAVDAFMPADKKFGWQSAQLNEAKLKDTIQKVVAWGRRKGYLQG